VKCGKQIRAGFCLLLAFVNCSCATVYRGTCSDSPCWQPGREVTVISDIDDTIKDTHIKVGETHFPNPTIVLDGLRPWRAVPGMALLYGQWHYVNKREFVYLSAGPCRYHRRLEDSIKKWCFPCGPIVLRQGGTLLPPADYKAMAIAPIIRRAPGHHFILVGDSGEFDPECYGELAREFPSQIDHIFIREISRGSRDSPRYHWDFRGVLAKYTLFTSPAEATKL
jgi:phosphatidate phosphatase APP1